VIRTLIAVLFLSLFASGVHAADAPDAADDGAPLKLPLTLERIWYRTASQTAFGKVFKAKGDLTVTEEGLEFVTSKKTLWFPMEQVRHITYGKMKGDVNTEWAILATGNATPSELIGFRDGRKLGYGTRTRDIFKTLRRVVKELGVAQYVVRPGLEPHDGMESQCFLHVPEGWHPYLESLSVGDGRRPWGTIIFSSKPVPRGGTTEEGATAEVLKQIRAGEVPAIFVARNEAPAGMECEGLSEGERKKIQRQVSSHPLLERGYELQGEVAVEPATVGGCKGYRMVARGKKPDGREIVVEIVVVAHGDTLFVFGLKARPENHAAYRETLDVTLETVQFSVVRVLLRTRCTNSSTTPPIWAFAWRRPILTDFSAKPRRGSSRSWSRRSPRTTRRSDASSPSMGNGRTTCSSIG